jgi:ABC-type multidrug transport system ATPase subunit
MFVLATQNLTKKYGNLTAVNNLDLKVSQGCIFGILGPNGSGKTTTLGMLLSVTHPTVGSFEWFGEKANDSHRKRIGAILESPIFYPYLSGQENLKVVAKIKQVAPKYIEESLRQVGLYERRNDVFSTYSLGMKQRLAIGAALLGNPEVLILDEPTNGLDPQGIADIRHLIVEIGKQGKTILLASHLLDEVEKVCSEVAILQKGKLLYNGTVAGLSSSTETSKMPKIEIACDEIALLQEKLQHFADLAQMEVQSDKLIVQLKTLNSKDLNKYLFENEIILSHLVTQKKSLEDKFLEILK